MFVWMLLLFPLAFGETQVSAAGDVLKKLAPEKKSNLDTPLQLVVAGDVFKILVPPQKSNLDPSLQQACGGEIREKKGFITSPGFPNDYPNNANCIWDIIAEPNAKIKLNFTDFATEDNKPSCTFDYVLISSILSGGRSKLEGRFCGFSIPSAITSEDNHLRIQFRSDGSNQYKGFKAFFKVDSSSKSKHVEWLQNQIKRRKAIELPRATLALFLAEPGLFEPEENTATELRDKITISILAQMARNSTIYSQDLALYIQALMVTCQDPRDFYGHDLVFKLRQSVDRVSEFPERVDRPQSFIHPFEILALCNAGADVTARDVAKVSSAFFTPLRPFWTDIQAIAAMAMQCLSSKMTVDEREIEEMQDELKKRQFKNGTLESLITTALVVQALRYNNSFQEFFNLSSALEFLMAAQDEDGSWGQSVRNSFYILPAISGKSFLDINDNHCSNKTESEDETLAGLQEATGEKFEVQYSVWIGDNVDLIRTWRVKVQSNKNSSFYDILQMVSKLDNKHNVAYQVVNGKPYVRALLGKEDDPQLGIFWFTYVRSTTTKEIITHVESSPVDIRVIPNQELILWYKFNDWKSNNAPKP